MGRVRWLAWRRWRAVLGRSMLTALRPVAATIAAVGLAPGEMLVGETVRE